MDILKKRLSPEIYATLEEMNKTKLINSEQKILEWKGRKHISTFSLETAEYAYNNWAVREGDVFIASYPKTGTNWTLEIMRRILYQNEELRKSWTGLPLPLGVFEAGQSSKFAIMDQLPFSRRLMVSHLPAELMNIKKIKNANAKVVYVLRNPKDQLVSHQHFLKATAPTPEVKAMVDTEWSNYLEKAITGNLPNGLKNEEWYPDHVRGWYQHLDNKNVYFVYYENMKKNLPKEVKKLSEFLEVSLTDEAVSKIADACTFANMKKNFASENFAYSKLIADIVMRKGAVGDWKNYFTVAQSERIDDIITEKFKGTDITFTYQL